MLKGNATPTTLNSDESFKQIISEARVSHQRSKDGAAEAAANAYMLWLSTQSDQATKEAAAWIKKEIELANPSPILIQQVHLNGDPIIEETMQLKANAFTDIQKKESM